MIYEDKSKILSRVIKQELKAKGFGIKTFSKKLGISEPTLKRWLVGTGLSLKDWLRMLEVLDLSFEDVINRADLPSVNQFEYTEKQEEVLSKTLGLLAFFQQLLQGCSAKKIASQHELTKKSVAFYLRKLDDLGLIRWERDLNCKLLRHGEPVWKKNGPLARTFRAKAFAELVVANKETGKLRLAIYNIPFADLQELESKINDTFQFAQAAEKRVRITKEKSQTLGIASVMSEYQPDFLHLIPNI